MDGLDLIFPITRAAISLSFAGIQLTDAGTTPTVRKLRNVVLPNLLNNSDGTYE